MAAQFTVPAVFKAVDKLTAPVKRMQQQVGVFGQKTVASMQKASIAMNQFANKATAGFSRIKKALGTLGLVAGFALLTQTVGSAINTFAEFEQANAGLAAVMGKTVQENARLTADAKRLGAVTAKSATEVVSLQEAFARLGFGEQAILDMTQSTISGSVAMQGELADTAELVGAMVKSFDQFESANAPMIIDQLTKSTQTSALSFEKLQTALPIVAGAANAAGVPFTKLLSSLGKISDAGIDASSASTALRNIFLVAAKQGVSYETLLQQVANSTDQLATANKLFGARGAVVAVTLAKQMKGINDLDKSLQAAGGTAETAANKQLDTLKGSITILGSAWEGFILSLDDGTGKFSTLLKTVVKTVTELLSMASGTAKAKEELTAAELKIRSIAEKVIMFGKILRIAVVGMIAFKTAMIAMNAAIAIGKFAQLAQQFLILTKAKGLATAAQWALNAAMTANPVGVIIVAIVALVGVIVLLVKKWDVVRNAMLKVWQVIENNAILKLLIWPLYSLIKVIQLIVQNFDAVKMAIVNFWAILQNNFIFQLLVLPITLAIKAIRFLIQNFDAIKTVAMNVFTSLQGLFSNIGAFFQAIGKLIAVSFQVAFSQVVEFLNPLLEAFNAFFNKIKAFAGKLLEPFQPVIEFFQGLGETIKTSIIDKFKELGGFVTAIIDKISKFFGGATQKINAKTEQLVKVQTDPVNSIVGSQSTEASKNITNNFLKETETIQNVQKEVVSNSTNNNTRELITDRKQEKQQQDKSRVDVFLNNRTGGNAEIYAEGTDVNVENTGY